MFDRIAPRYDLLNRLITLGTHRRWKRAAIEALGTAPGSRVLDLACGTGDLLFELERVRAHGLGVDVSAGMLSAARRRGAPGTLVRASADALPLADASCDGIVCGFALRNFVSIEDVLRETARVLRPGAPVAFVEVDRPRSRTLAGLHRAWFERVVPLVGRLASDAAAYRYLPASAAYLPDDAGMRALLARAGFGEARKRTFLLGAAQLVTARRSETPC
jgi:demethylmenaquinone methyltransferase/2-methoxy-6-polyprenyl-1,4-benzoquinol methylase